MAKIIYNGNGSTAGSAPTDSTNYANGAQVTILGNTGSLKKNSDTFAYWNTAADGTGTFLTPNAKFTIGASDVTLFAMWYTTTGLTNGGTTTHYQVAYDAVLATAAFANIEPARTNSILANAANGVPIIENDFTWMQQQFAGVDITKARSLPLQVFVSAPNGGGYGASWYPVILGPGNRPASLLRTLMVAEIVEIFMAAQDKGWGYSSGIGNEESAGEGLSLFLAVQFQIAQGLGINWLNNGTPTGWLNTSLPSSNPSSTEFDGTTHYGSRADYINSTLPFAGNGPGTGCSVAFLYYLFHQLGFSSIPQIVAGAPGVDSSNNILKPCLRGVYQNLTGDTSDPFPFFKLLLDNAYPPSSVSSIPGPNVDDPFPLALASFWVDKNTFGKDEVQDIINTHAGKFTNAFWLIVEGFSINQFNALGVTVPAFTGAFAGIPGVSITRSSTPIDFENSSQPNRLQRIRIAFDITFNSTALAQFPKSGKPAKVLELDGKVTVSGSTPTGATCATVFELTAGADPYFTNIDPTQNNVFYLSQDLRVFKATPGKNNTPVSGGPAFGSDDTAGAFTYITQLLNYLNTNFADPSGIDPFSTLLPGQSGALSGDSSVSPVTVDITFPTTFPPIPQINIYNNYNFAVARVRLRGLANDVASNTKVFFRLWSTQTADTDFAPTTTYLSTQTGGHPSTPLVGVGNHTIPFFATGNFGSNTDYNAGGVNNQNIKLDIGDSKWAYFGCFLNIYDSTNVINGQTIQSLLNGTHHCLVAEIASDSAPILNSSLVTLGPENSDKLAQRNLQFTSSDNPGGAASHRIPQTFDVRPSAALIEAPGTLLNYPDELMIDWGNTPVGSTANIYWPQVNASDVIALATKLYSHSELSASDPHTISCPVTAGVTYVPIPHATGDNFAGLITIDLPTTVVVGQEFNIVVRRVATRRNLDAATGRQPQLGARGGAAFSAAHPHALSLAANNEVLASNRKGPANWRYVTGTFQIRIPVGSPATLLGPERNTLAIFKWRLLKMSPANRWYPVLQRYIQYLGARVSDLGGNPDAVPPSPLGYWEIPTGAEPSGNSFTGKIAEVIFDCRGRMEGFILRECCDREHRFTVCDRDLVDLVLQACTGRYEVTVQTGTKNAHSVHRLIVRG
jgi:hypothetical protein